MLPFIIVFLVKFVPLIGHVQHLQPGLPPDQRNRGGAESILFIGLPVLLVCAHSGDLFERGWKFTLPLIIDKELDFWTAMKTSRKQGRQTLVARFRAVDFDWAAQCGRA